MIHSYGFVSVGAWVLAAALVSGMTAGAHSQSPPPPPPPTDADGAMPPARDQGDAPDACGPVAAADCACHVQTVWVPRMTTETREIPVTRYRMESRERERVEYRCVPEPQTVTRMRTVMQPVTRTRTVEYTVRRPEVRTREVSYTLMNRVPRTETVSYTVARPVWETVQQEYTVQVPHHEVREGVRRVCELVPVTKTRTVCRMSGHWETRASSPCSGCSCHPSGCPSACGSCTQRCWVPEVVHEEVPYTTYEPHWKEVPYQYTVTVCRPETRVRDVQVCRMVNEQQTRDVTRFELVPETRTRQVQETIYVNEPRTREVSYTAYVPEQREEAFQVTTYRMVPETKVQTYPICVPYTEMQQKQVQVCHWVQETREVCGYESRCPDACACTGGHRAWGHRLCRLCR